MSSVSRAFSRFRILLGVPSLLVIVLFFFVSLVGEIFTEAVSSVHMRLWTLGALALIAFVLVLHFDRRLAASRTSSTDHPRLRDRRGLVIVLGLDSDLPTSAAAKLLLRAGSSEYVALITTPTEPGKKNVAEALISRLLPVSAPHLLEANVRTFVCPNVPSTVPYEQAVSQAITWMHVDHNLNFDDIVVDISAGRRPMLLGANVAAMQAGVDTQYLAADWDNAPSRADAASASFSVISR